ncbi:Eisosome component PIL1-domain-containing protein [Halteromyces radiatus]|uniref:Eisosome component PIL1-domain-containing protein n=1 Tax=Halteromyces radiatus TaxID=101107 RepID=UPI00221F8013|nr:Eisosome component PIL1-domain-containing protein [Halteromyces radiatus]KAI8088675.1 Eisosome component PIL1-domain-containing protein [Halteromyces radiatus]
MFSFNPFHSFTSKSNQQDPGLQQLLENGKKMTSQWLLLGDEQRIAANDLVIYGRPLGDDLTDVTSKLGSLMTKWSEILANFAGSYDQYQLTLKSIAERESTLYNSREKKQKLQESIDKLEQDHPGAVDKVTDLKRQLAELNQATEVDEREMDNFKRMAMREAFYLLLNGMHEMASKTDVISSFGKYVVDELDVTPVKEGEERKPYQGSDQTTRIVSDASYAMEHWKPDGAKVRRTLTSHHGRNPLVSKNKALPPAPVESELSTTINATTDSQDSNDDRTLDNNNIEESSSSPSQPEEEPTSLLKQDSIRSLHKPDAVEEDLRDDDDLPLAPMSPRPQSATLQDYSQVFSPSPQQQQFHGHSGGFSTVYLGLPDHQKLYQFYTNYSPPKSYEEMSRILSPQAVFHPSPQQQRQSVGQSPLSPSSSSSYQRMDAGGFALPGGNPPSYLVPQPSVSTSSATSVTSNGSQGSRHEQILSPSTSSSITQSSPPSSSDRYAKFESKVSALRAKFQAD